MIPLRAMLPRDIEYQATVEIAPQLRKGVPEGMLQALLRCSELQSQRSARE